MEEITISTFLPKILTMPTLKLSSWDIFKFTPFTIRCKQNSCVHMSVTKTPQQFQIIILHPSSFFIHLFFISWPLICINLHLSGVKVGKVKIFLQRSTPRQPDIQMLTHLKSIINFVLCTLLEKNSKKSNVIDIHVFLWPVKTIIKKYDIIGSYNKST